MDQRSAQAIAAAMAWVAKIFAVAMAMALPAVVGSYLDHAWKTRFATPTGVVIGFVAGMAYLISLTKSTSSNVRIEDDEQPRN